MYADMACTQIAMIDGQQGRRQRQQTVTETLGPVARRLSIEMTPTTRRRTLGREPEASAPTAVSPA
jgi:hypothetical protein